MTETLRIAVADDEQDVREYFCRMLPRMGHKVVVAAENGRDLVAQCRAHQPDLIIADVRMPELDGDLAIQEICALRPTPFILISAHGNSTETPNSQSEVNSVYLTKPINRKDLEWAIALVCPTFSD